MILYSAALIVVSVGEDENGLDKGSSLGANKLFGFRLP